METWNGNWVPHEFMTPLKDLHKLPQPPSGVKHDQNKLPLDLLDPVALDGLAAVLQFGANK